MTEAQPSQPDVDHLEISIQNAIGALNERQASFISVKGTLLGGLKRVGPDVEFRPNLGLFIHSPSLP